MDRTSLKQGLKGAATGKFGIFAGLVGVGVIALTVGMRVGKSNAPVPHGAELASEKGEGGEAGHESHEAAQEAHAEHVAMKGEESQHPVAHHESMVSKVLGTYASAWDSLQEKVEDVRTAEIENERLRLENTHLRLQLEGLQFNCSAKEASTKTHAIEYKLDHETGSQVGRDLASIAYRVPTNLVPGQLYTLGISYFKAREDEKAAVIFTFLTGLDENDTFRTPKNYLLTGIAWYRLDNFATAERYFDRALKAPESTENLQTLAHARLWKALVANRTGKHTQSQFWLTELIDHHPLSLEASWVNSKGIHPKSPEAHRGVASDPEE